LSHLSVLIVHHDRDAATVSEAVGEIESLGLMHTATPGVTNTPCVEIELTDSVFDEIESTERRLQKVTRKFGLHVALVLAVSVSDAFLYIHWHNGRVVRALACSFEDDGVWSRVSGDPEEWEADAFDGEEVETPGSGARRLGRNAEGAIDAPQRGDISVPPDVMKYADLAREFHLGLIPE